MAEVIFSGGTLRGRCRCGKEHRARGVAESVDMALHHGFDLNGLLWLWGTICWPSGHQHSKEAGLMCVGVRVDC